MKIKNIFSQKKEKRSTNGVIPFADALCFGGLYNSCSAMNLSAVYRATELISDGIATLPIKIQQINKENGKTEIDDHPLKKIFGNKQNGNNLSIYTIMKMLIQSVILNGNGFAYIDRENDGTVKSLRYIESNDVQIIWNKYTNNLYYQTTVLKGKVNIEPINMIHLVKNSYDGINGVSVLGYANRTIQTSNATENSAKSFFENGMNLSGVLTVQSQLQQKQKDEIRSSWSQAYSNGGQGLAVLQGNMTYQPIQINSKDAQMIESRQYNVQDIARFFGISPVLLGDLSHTSYNTIEAVQNDFLLHTLQPYVTMVENEFNRKLLKPSEDNLQIILETNEILRTDKQAQASYYSTLLQNGIMSVNEIRKELGFNPISDGDKHIIPFTDLSMNTFDKNNQDTKGEGHEQKQGNKKYNM